MRSRRRTGPRTGPGQPGSLRRSARQTLSGSIGTESMEAIETNPAPLVKETPTDAPGGSRELLKLATPLIVSQSFMTVQVFVDTILLSWHDPREMAASFPAVMWYWLPFGLVQVTAGYTSTFVAQYMGAGRPHRAGPAV